MAAQNEVNESFCRSRGFSNEKPMGACTIMTKSQGWAPSGPASKPRATNPD
jgi:hypothetical protein